MDKHVGLSAPVQSGRCAGLLARPPRRQQKAHCGGMRRVRAGAHPEQRVLRPQLQLLCPLVLYAGAHPCRHDGERTGGSQHRSGHPGPGPWLDHAGYAGLCTGARAGQRHRHLVAGCAQEPRPVFRGAGLWPGRIAALPSGLPEMAGRQPLCPAHDGGGGGLCLRVQYGAHRHRQVRPMVHRQRSCGAGQQRPAAEGGSAGRRLPRGHLQNPRQHRHVAGQELPAIFRQHGGPQHPQLLPGPGRQAGCAQ